MINRLETELEMLTRHLEVLGLVIAHESIGIVNISHESGYRKYKVRYSLRTLEEAGLIEPSSEGAITTDRIGEFVTGFDNRLEATIEWVDTMNSEGTGACPKNIPPQRERHAPN